MNDLADYFSVFVFVSHPWFIVMASNKKQYDAFCAKVTQQTVTGCPPLTSLSIAKASRSVALCRISDLICAATYMSLRGGVSYLRAIQWRTCTSVESHWKSVRSLTNSLCCMFSSINYLPFCPFVRLERGWIGTWINQAKSLKMDST